MRERKRRVGYREQTAGTENLLGHQDVLGEVAAERVADGDLAHALCALEVALAMIDRRMVDGGLDHEALADGVAVLQLLADFDQRDRPLVAEDQRPPGRVPAVEELVRRPLFDELDQRRADAGGIHARERLAWTRSRSRHLFDPHVLEPGSTEHECPHLGGDRRQPARSASSTGSIPVASSELICTGFGAAFVRPAARSASGRCRPRWRDWRPPRAAP